MAGETPQTPGGGYAVLTMGELPNPPGMTLSSALIFTAQRRPGPTARGGALSRCFEQNAGFC